MSLAAPSGRVIDPGDPNAATRLVWERLAKPFAVRSAARSVIGLPPEFIAQLEGFLIATSPQAEALLAAMPEMLRNLVITTVQTPERCQGEVRGPVLWSETVAARAGTAGATDVFICLTPRRAYDTSQNRVLVAALTALRRAAVDADRNPHDAQGDAILAKARENGDRARRFLEHRTLREISRTRPSRRDIGKAAAGRRSRQYQPAVDLLREARDPLDLDALLPLVDARTAWQHWLIMTLVGRLHAGGVDVGRFQVVPNGDLKARTFTYRHPEVAAQTGKALHGVFLDGFLIDVPEQVGTTDFDRAEAALASRASGRVPILVTGPGDIDKAVQAVLGTVN